MSADKHNSIVVAGCGWVSPFALGGVTEVLHAASSATTPANHDGPAWLIPDVLLEQQADLPNEVLRERDVRIASTALQLACKDAAISLDELCAERVGIVLGCGLAGQAGMIAFANEVRQQTARFVTPLHFPQTVGNYVAGALGRAFKIRGPNLTLSSGVASGLDAIVTASQLLAADEVDIVFAGGFDVLSNDMVRGTSIDGVPAAEGACIFVLQRCLDVAAGSARSRALIGPGRQISSNSPLPRDEGIISCAGLECCDSIFIEHRIGRCGAAAGAATLAAALGAAAGLPVPMSTAEGAHAVSVRTINDDGENSVAFLLAADGVAGHRTILSVKCPRCRGE